MKAKITQEIISTLESNQIFVFGSNTSGQHGGGAARKALEDFGAINGQGVGMHGKSYAIPTLSENLEKLLIQDIQNSVNEFEKVVKQRTDLHFLITPIGTGIAGFSVKEMAILFAGFQEYENVSLPQNFIDVIGEIVVHGYKAVNIERNEDGSILRRHCREFNYELGSVYFHNNNISICNNGFHFCVNIIDTLKFYDRSENVGYVKVLGCGSIQNEEDKHCVSILKIKEEYLSTDKDWNSGNSNSGNSNSGNRNSGDRNSGNRNSGNRNSGDSNSGDSNSGNRNSGNRNSGNWNSGNWNSGNWNSGNSNSGYLNTITPKLFIFNKETDIKKEDIYFPNWLNFQINKWIDENYLSEEQKINNPHYNICGGALVKFDYKQAVQKSYSEATKEEQRCIEDLPNYDAEILFEIFGIDRRKK